MSPHINMQMVSVYTDVTPRPGNQPYPGHERSAEKQQPSERLSKEVESLTSRCERTTLSIQWGLVDKLCCCPLFNLSINWCQTSSVP